MRALFSLIACGLLLSGACMARAKAPTHRAPSSASGLADCEKAALDVANYIEQSGWGKSSGFVPHTVSKSELPDNVYEYYVRISDDRNDSPSGYTYKVDMIQDYRSHACITLSVDTKG